MTSDKEAAPYVQFSKATKAEILDSHTYAVDLNDAFCIGAVPNGGYTASCVLAAARTHLLSRGQPDTLTAHFEYPTRSAAGPAIVVVEDVKLGRQMSILHLTLWQDGLLSQAPWIDPSVSRRTVLAYATQTNLHTSTGMTVPTGHEVTAAAALPPPPDFDALRTRDADDHWEEAKLPKYSEMVPALRNWRFYLPRGGPLTIGVLDMWIRMASGERITQGALTYVSDSFPYNMHLSLASPEVRKLLEAPPDRAGENREDDPGVSFWCPTLVMNLEVKMALPEKGVEWLAVQTVSKQMKDGKFDLDVTVRDVDGELVALSQQVALLVSFDNNVRKRGVTSKPLL